MSNHIQELKNQGEDLKKIEKKLEGISEATSSSHSSLNELEKSACRRFLEYVNYCVCIFFRPDITQIVSHTRTYMLGET